MHTETSVSKNAVFLLDRLWGFSTARRRWICKRNGRELDHSIVESATYDRLRNLATLIERGFEVSNGHWRKGTTVVDSRMVEVDHEKFRQYLFQVLRGQAEKAKR